MRCSYSVITQQLTAQLLAKVHFTHPVLTQNNISADS